MNTVDNLNPARYAAQLAETIGSLHRHLAAEQPDWWQQVVDELHSRLDKEFPPFYDCQECGAALYAAFATCEECGHKFNQGADMAHGAFGDDWDTDYCRVCGIHNQSTHAPWCEYRDGTPVAEIDRWRLFGDWVNERLTALETKSAL